MPTYTFYRVPPSSSRVAANFAYTNEQFYVSRPLAYSDFPGNGTYYVNLTWTNQTSPVAYFLSEWYKAVVSGTTLSVFIEPPGQEGSGNFTYAAPLYSAGQMGAGFFGFPTNLFSQQDMISQVTGSYAVVESFCNTWKGAPYLTNNIPGQFDLRALVLQPIQTSPPRINPLANDTALNTSQITGTWTALPATSVNYPTGWTTAGPISWTIPIQLGFTSPVAIKTITGNSTAAGSPSSGPIGSLASSWNGRDTAGAVVEGSFNFAIAATAPTVQGTTIAIYQNLSVITSSRCSCLDGSTRSSVSPDLFDSPVGPPIVADMGYNSMYNGVSPSSMGYGWNSVANVQAKLDTATQITYRDENGNFLSWNLVTGVWVPSTRDNYATITATSPITITFKNKTKRVFNASGQLVNEIDTNNQTTTYQYDGSARLIQATDAKGRNMYWAYSGADKQPNSIRAFNSTSGNQTQLVYYPPGDPIAPGRLKQVITPMKDTTSYTYTAISVAGSTQVLISQVFDPTGAAAITYSYDSLGRVVGEQFYDQKYIQTRYDTALAVSGGTLSYPPANAVTKIEYDLTLEFDINTNNRQRISTRYFDKFFNVIRIDEVVDPNANPIVIRTTLMEYNDLNVPKNPYLLTKVTDPNLNTTSMTYSAAGDMLTETDKNGSVTTYTYNSAGQVLTILRPAVTVNGVLTTYPATTMTYDGNFNLTNIQNAYLQNAVFMPNADGTVQYITDFNGHTTNFTYYPAGASKGGNLNTVKLPAHPGDPVGPGRLTTFAYDNYDNVTSVTDALGNVLTSQFDSNRRLTATIDALTPANTTTYTYGPTATGGVPQPLAGLLISITEPSNQGSSPNLRKTYCDYDSANRLGQVSRDFSTTTQVIRAQYVRDGFSNLVQLWRQQTAGGVSNVTSWTYDNVGRPVTSINPLGQMTLTNYSKYCSKTQTTSARGVRRTLTKDALCRLTQVQTGNLARVFTYDQLSRMVSDLTGPVYGAGVYGTDNYANGRTMTYDKLDRVTNVLFNDGTSMAYTYDNVGNVLTFTDNFNRVTTYTYYDDDLLKTVSFVYNSVTYLFTYNYDLAGRLFSIVYPGNITCTYAWNNNGWLLSMTYMQGATLVQSFGYTYDNSGNRKTMSDNNGTTTVNWSYDYDWLNRLVSASNGTTTTTYSYDNCDNRLTRVQGSTTKTFKVDVADQLLSVTTTPGGAVESFVHDADGNMISRTVTPNTTSYGWNDFDNLNKFSLNGTVQESEVYDSDGTRRFRSDGTKYYTEGGTSVAESRPTAAGQVSFIKGHQLLGIEQGNSVYLYLSDGLGSVRRVLNSNGTATSPATTIPFDEFGVPGTPTGPAELLTNTFVGALGVRNESARGLYYMNQRFYAPDLGRFVSRDPIGMAADLNRYSYSGAAPTTWVDPSGLAFIKISYTGMNMVGGRNVATYNVQLFSEGNKPGALPKLLSEAALTTSGTAGYLPACQRPEDQTKIGDGPTPRGIYRLFFGEIANIRKPWDADVNAGDRTGMATSVDAARGTGWGTARVLLNPVRGFDPGFPFGRSQMYLHTHGGSHVSGTAGCMGMLNEPGEDFFDMLQSVGKTLKAQGIKDPSIRVIIGH